MLPMEIIDTHVHFWDRAKPFNAWLDSPSDFCGDCDAINHSYLPSHYRQDTQGKVAKAIHVEAATPSYARQEVEWFLQLAKTEPLLQGMLAGVQLASDEAPALLDFYASEPLVKGVREIFITSPGSTASEAEQIYSNQRWSERFGQLGKQGLNFDLLVSGQQLEVTYHFLKRFPETVTVLEHFCLPGAEGVSTWQAGMRNLAELTQVNVKLSAPAMLGWLWGGFSFNESVLFLLETFGVERCLFGSNFPVDKLYQNFSEHFSQYEKLLITLSEDERHALLVRNAERIYRV